MEMIALDCHKHYSVASVQTPEGQCLAEGRIEHRRGSIRAFLAPYSAGCPVAVETIGNWYWIIDEIEQAGKVPRLVHARKAKLMLGSINKTDKLDVRGLNKLQQAGTLPTVWIPPATLRDQRELPRTRMIFSTARTRLKNRIHSVLDKYGLQDQLTGISDLFAAGVRERLQKSLQQLPTQAAYTSDLLLEQLDQVQETIEALEQRMRDVFQPTEELQRLDTLPGVGLILGVVLLLEIGDIQRFRCPEHLASYAGTVPRVHSSGGKTHYGRTRPDVNHYLKWAYTEAGNAVAVHREHLAQRHVGQLYSRIRLRRGHASAVGAVARHLAEATYWMLTKKECYRERGISEVSPQGL